jgi:hypothetical protein
VLVLLSSQLFIMAASFEQPPREGRRDVLIVFTHSLGWWSRGSVEHKSALSRQYCCPPPPTLKQRSGSISNDGVQQ